MLSRLTHAQLVSRAARWLRNTRRCSVVMVETGCWLTQIPDAIGWDWRGRSIAVECKVSVADFRADAHKTNPPIGRRRFFMTPPWLLTARALPDGHGLLEVHGRRVRVIREATMRVGYSSAIELPLLVAEIRRVAGGSNRARLFVADEGGNDG